MICCKTVIGYGSPNKGGTHNCHGAPLGPEEILATRKQLGWEYGDFEVPDEIYNGWNATNKGNAQEEEWNELFNAFEEGSNRNKI